MPRPIPNRNRQRADECRRQTNGTASRPIPAKDWFSHFARVSEFDPDSELSLNSTPESWGLRLQAPLIPSPPSLNSTPENSGCLTPSPPIPGEQRVSDCEPVSDSEPSDSEPLENRGCLTPSRA